MKNISIWKDTVNEVKYPKLNSDKEVEVLIIGGGITGVSTYYFLKNSNLNVMLVEQNKIGFGVTANSTGKLSYLQNDLLDKIRKNFGDDKASLYLKSQLEAINIVKELVEKEKIDCDLEKVDSLLYTNLDKEVNKLKDLEKFLKDNNIDVEITTNGLVESKYMIKVHDTYMFHPLKFIYGLINDKDNIYEDTSIQKIKKEGDFYVCYTDKYKIKAKYVVVATHYPYFNIPFLFPVKCSLEKSYLSASKYNGEEVSLISYSNPFISIRSYKDYLIYLSNSHLVNNDIDDEKNYEELSKKVTDINLNPNYLWSNIDIMTNDSLPYIGTLEDNILIGTGYNTWGLASSVLAGKILSDIIGNRDNQYIELFSPKRFNLSKFIGSFPDIINSFSGYIKGYLSNNDDINYEKVDKEKIMTYKDNNKEYKVYRKCPHMGCNLVFNKIEKTWDCPCHGSRFDIEGKCINAPAKEDIRFM